MKTEHLHVHIMFLGTALVSVEQATVVPCCKSDLEMCQDPEKLCKHQWPPYAQCLGVLFSHSLVHPYIKKRLLCATEYS